MMDNQWRNILHPEVVSGFAEQQSQPISAVPTPLAAWNSSCHDAGGGVGLAHGWHVIIAGATGHGKTLMALNLTAEALRQGHDVCYVSLEMSREQLQTRVYSILTGVGVSRLERGHFDAISWQKAREDLLKIKTTKVVEGHELDPLPPLLMTNTGPIRNIHEIAQTMTAFHEDHGIRFFVIDYLQLAKTGTDEEVYRAVSEISATVMEFSHSREVVTVGLSQLNRSTSANRDMSPTAHGLIGSSSLENDADQVVVLDHSRYKRDDLNTDLARTWLILAKNRHGKQGSIPIEWNYRTLRVREALPDEEGDWPGVERSAA